MSEQTITLPQIEIAAASKSPKRLVIYSPPKMGKTTLVAGLKNCLLLDLEDGSDFVTALKIKANTYQELGAICEEIKKQGKPYSYGAVDTTTALEDMCVPLALKLYQQTPMGKDFKGHILSLPNGAGYLYLRNAFELTLDKIQSAFPRVILLGHIKSKITEKAGKEVNSKDIDLTGKIRNIVCAGADAIAYLYRDKDKSILSFNTSDEITCGARPLHLRNQEIVIGEEKNGKVQTFWERVYID